MPLLFCGCGIIPESDTDIKPPHAFGKQSLLRGINLGNAWEAPVPGDWGVTIEPEYFTIIRAAGFNSVRIPIRFSAHTDQNAPYSIDSIFLDEVDQLINLGLDAGLTVILDLHHFEEIMENPAGQEERFLEIWRQLSEHYQNAPSVLFFELLNEPNQQLEAQTWNNLLQDTIPIIRKHNPDRKIIIGGVDFNSVESLDTLQLPSDKNLIATIHFYLPFEFTHQGAAWIAGSENWVGKTWSGTPAETQVIIEQLDRAVKWSASHQIPVIMGEFGTIAKADQNSRQLWTEFIAREAGNRNIGWLYWEFCSEFKVYDCQQKTWDTDLLGALFP